MRRVLFMAGFGIVGKAFVEKYLKDPIFSYWLQQHDGRVDELSNFLFSLLTSCFIAVIALCVYLITSSPEEKVPSQPASTELMSSKHLEEIMKKRRSIFPKDYTDELISDEEINHLIECANTAPTHGKNEPWRFVVYRRDQIPTFFAFVQKWYEDNASKVFNSPQEEKDALALMKTKFGELSKASHLILLGMKRYASEKNKFPEWEEVAAVATSVQNIYLQTAAKGLAGFWSTMTFMKFARDSGEMRQLLNLSHNEDRLLGGFVIGKTTDLSRFTRIPEDYKKKVEWR